MKCIFSRSLQSPPFTFNLDSDGERKGKKVPNLYHWNLPAMSRISTALGRCTWPRDLARRVFLAFFLLPPPLRPLCPCPPIICACILQFICFTYKNGFFFLGCAAPCVNIWGLPEIGLDALSCWGAESCWTCWKILKLLECVWIGSRCVKIEKK